MVIHRFLLLVLASTSLGVWSENNGAMAAVSPGMARIAVAGNFTQVAHVLAEQYTKQSGNHIQISIASTGKLYAQIHNGAPFDVLLAADTVMPECLVEEGLAVPSSVYSYATGRLVLFSRDAALIQGEGEVLRKYNFRKFAIANPELAPYGAAARDVLQHIGRWDELKPHLVLGENVAQATQFVMSGNAEVGLLPRSLVLELQQSMDASSWLVPASWHQPIIQSAVLLQRGKDNPAAIGFLEYLHSDAARRIIAAHGYD